MKSYFISDNHDTWVGLRLAGLEGVLLHEQTEILAKFKQLLNDPNIGLIIITEKIMDIAPDEIMDYKMKHKTPLIIEIPDRHGSSRKEDRMTRYIRDSVGIRI